MQKQTIFLLVIALLQGCGSATKMDPYEKLARPPQLVVTPTNEIPAIIDEQVVSNGLGKNVVLHGKRSAPVLTLNMDFDQAWQVLKKVLRYEKIDVTDQDREQGQILANFDTDLYEEDAGFWAGLSDQLLAENYGLRKYQLTVQQRGNKTHVIATDLGAITTQADREEDIDEVVDTTAKGPANSQLRLLSTLHKSLRDGFIEPEMQHKPGRFDLL